jgi:2-desacetyl-2-hydroxyethyl bacteriochlorophyllide A dehydrogenase
MVTYPRVLGHELLVDVVDAPDAPDLVGKRVVVEPLLSCGRCIACRKGRYNCCTRLRTFGVHTDGGLADLSLAPVQRLHPVPDGMADEVAVLAEPTTVAYRAVQRSGAEAGQTAVVFGAGAIGLLVSQLLMRARGCRVLVSELDPWRRQLAARLGAVPLDPTANLAAQVGDHTGGELAAVVIEATGQRACTRATTDVVAHTGRIVLVGWNEGPVELDTVTLMRKEAEVFGSRNSTGAFPPVLQLLADGVIDARSMVTHRFSLEETARAFELLAQGGQQALKVIIGAQPGR